jgi:ppGpp synthetase/RelA/SpoT-type nucleotidyltranferase
MNKKLYSKKQIERAGLNFLSDEKMADAEIFSETLDILSFWRSCHTVPLDHAIKKLRTVVKKIDKNAIYAKRLKRYPSIVTKLRRFPKMSLKNMQDIGGCRVIVQNSKKVDQIIRELKRKPEFKCNKGKLRFKDYIKEPKFDGYRSYHIISYFPDEFNDKRKIEIQVRTRIQHYWATVLEIVDLFTKQSMKTNQGEKLWVDFFKKISFQFSIMDDIHLFLGLNQQKRFKEYVSKFPQIKESPAGALDVVELSEELGVIEKLTAFANSLKIVGDAVDNIKVNGYMLIEIDLKDTTLTYKPYNKEDAQIAEEEYTNAEKRSAQSEKNTIVALVYTDHLDGIRDAYPNFFADSTEFIQLLLLIHKSKSLFKKGMIQRWLESSNIHNFRQ